MRIEALNVGISSGRAYPQWFAHRLSDGPAWAETTVSGPAALRLYRQSPYRILLDGEVVAEPAGSGGPTELGWITIDLGPGTRRLRAELVEESAWLDPDNFARIESGRRVETRGIGVSLLRWPDFATYPEGATVRVDVSGAWSAQALEWEGLPADAVFVDGNVGFAVESNVSITAIQWSTRDLLGWNTRHAGNGEWTVNGESATRYLGSGDEDLLEFITQSAGIARFRFRMRGQSDNWNRVRAAFWLDGVRRSVAVFEGVGEEYLDAFVALDGTERRLRWRFSNLRTGDLQTESQRVELLSLGFVEEGDLPDFAQWWFDHELGEACVYGDLLLFDHDGDGLGALSEYALGSNPRRADKFLEIRRGGATPLELAVSTRLQELASPPIVQIATRPEFSWSEAAQELGAATIDPSDDAWQRWPIYGELRDRDVLLFRLKSDEALPASEAVFEPLEQ